MATATKLAQTTEATTSTRLLTADDVAMITGLSVETLAQWRSQRRGIPFVKISRNCVRYRKPDLERWLDEQIKFDGVWEQKVVERILHNLSLLFERHFVTVQDLNRYRKEITKRLAADGATGDPELSAA